MTASEPSPQVVEQRVRNRLIEWLEMLIDYVSDAPPFDLNEVLNQWEDWVPRCDGPDTFPEPTYTSSEAVLLVLVHDAWDSFCDSTPQTLADEPAALRTRQWLTLVAAGKSALRELEKRGSLSEQSEDHRL